MNNSSEDRWNNRVATALTFVAIALLVTIAWLMDRSATRDPNEQAHFHERVQLEVRLQACERADAERPHCTVEEMARYRAEIRELDRMLGIRTAGSDGQPGNAP